MAENFGGKVIEKVLGHGDQNRATHTDISNPDRDGGAYADESGEKMKALAWMGKNDVRVSTYPRPSSSIQSINMPLTTSQSSQANPN